MDEPQLMRERMNIPIIVLDGADDRAFVLLDFLKLDVDLDAETTNGVAQLYKLVNPDDPNPVVMRGNKEYRGRIEELPHPILVTREETQCDERVCAVHAVIRKKIVFERRPVFHFG